MFCGAFSHSGFPILGVEWQKMENPDLRMSMGMGPEEKGVRIKRIEPTAPESHLLKSSDVILRFDGVDIANDGTGEHYLIQVMMFSVIFFSWNSDHIF